MFQRIARRPSDRPDEPPTTERPVEPTPGSDAASAPAADVSPAEGAPAPAPVGDDTVEAAAVDAPTERLEPVVPPRGVEQPTAYQASVSPPPVMDLTTRLPSVPPGASPPPTEPAPAVSGPETVVPPPPAPTDTGAQTAIAEPAPRRPGFRARGRMRRRLRYLRKLRELQVRDLGGLAFDLRRFERKRDDLVTQKIDQIRACDDELRALELALEERRDVRDVREPGIGGTCPRCFAVFGSADKFCSTCGAAFGGAVQGPAAQIPLAPPPEPARSPETGASGPRQ